MPSSGDITGEGLDSGYGNDLDCVWNLEVPEDYFPELHFDFFSTEASYDFMTIYDTDGSELKKMDGEKSRAWLSGHSIVGSGNSLHIRFTSDVSAGGPGFRFAYEATKCAGGCNAHGVCEVNEVTVTSTGAAADATELIGQCVCDSGYFGHNCEMDTAVAIPCDQSSNSSCSGHGSCAAHGVCDCDEGFSTQVTETQLSAVEQCSFQQQCAVPYVETATNGSARVSSARGPADWSGECLFHIAAGDESMSTHVAIADMAMGSGDSLIISYGSPKQRIVVPMDSSTLDFVVPSGDIWIRFDVNGSYPLWALMFYWQTVDTTEAPSAFPTEAPSTGGDAVPTAAPGASSGDASSSRELVRSHAAGQVRLVGFIDYEQVKDPGTALYRDFVNKFETDIESFESARGRDTYCTVNSLSKGSVIVDFTLTVMLGDSDAAEQGLADMQQAMLDGSLSRIAGAPLDTSTQLVTDGNCAVCPTCPTAAPFVTEPTTEAPSSLVPDCIDNSNSMRPKSITLGIFVGFGVLLCGGFMLYGMCFLHSQSNKAEELQSEVQLGAVDATRPDQEYGQVLKGDDM